MTAPGHPGAKCPGPCRPPEPSAATGPVPPTETADPLPKMLPGAVCAQWRRCGKPACRCARGQPHGPYFFRFWRQGGKLRKVYVRPAELERVRAACRARQRQRRELAAAWAGWRQLQERVREVERR